MKMPAIIVSALVVLILLGLYLFTYSVPEQFAAIITEFGKPTGATVTQPGLHFKLPVVQTVNLIDMRMQEWDGQAVQMPTHDKLYMIVDSYGRWRVDDPLRFFTRMRDTRSALSRMDDITGSEMRDAVAKNDLIELVRTDKNRKVQLDIDPDNTNAQENVTTSTLPPISIGRTAIEQTITENAAAKLKDFGIDLVDVRLMRLNYQSTVTDRINERMISERAQIAAQFRSEGEGAADKILGDRDRDLAEIKSVAYQKTQEIQGQAEGEATRIYAEAYNQSAQALELYSFLRSMQTLEAVATNNTTLVLSTSGDLFKYLKSADAK
ncbi:MAG TPA: protease modulator HflC [Alphaproteobacteria bacterium]|nr:protease modulator HflC [Alphaproteobacteria bacterium]